MGGREIGSGSREVMGGDLISGRLIKKWHNWWEDGR